MSTVTLGMPSADSVRRGWPDGCTAARLGRIGGRDEPPLAWPPRTRCEKVTMRNVRGSKGMNTLFLQLITLLTVPRAELECAGVFDQDSPWQHHMRRML